MPDNEHAERLAKELEQHEDYRVLRRLKPVKIFADSTGRPVAKGVVVDTETTGLSDERDKIIEIGLVVFEYNPETGEPYRVVESYGALEDPGVSITPEITDITGITNEMVVGKRINDEKVNQLVKGASVVIAHNARFDRGFLERRLPVFESLPWGCSFAHIDWDGEGLSSRKLDYIAYQMGFFFGAHRAEADCLALLEILRRPLPKTGKVALKSIIDFLPQKDWTVFALKSPFETKDTLKARKYSWDAIRSCWHRTVTGTDAITAETVWLKENIYGGRSVTLEFEVRDALLRFSKRLGKRTNKAI